MPTSRYESYAIPSNDTESKEEIVGEYRLEQKLGRVAVESTEEED